jgi:hypothetical protein
MMKYIVILFFFFNSFLAAVFGFFGHGFSGSNQKKATGPWVLWLQLEGGYNHLVLRLQPKGSSNSLILCLQPEEGYNPLSLPHLVALKYKCRPTVTTKITATITATVTVTAIVTSTCPTCHCDINLSNQSLSHPKYQIHSLPHVTHDNITKSASQTICSTSSTHGSTKHVPRSPHTIIRYVS